MPQLPSKRSFRIAFPFFLLLTAMTLPPDPYKKIGQGRFTNDCTPQGGIFTTTCRNIPEVDLLNLSTPEQRAAAARWIQSTDRKWGTESAMSPRANGQEFTIESNRVLKWVALKKVNSWTPKMIVVARITAKPDLPTDARYNIGKQPGYTMSKYFYMAVREYDDSNTSEKYESRKVSMWSTYGLATPNGSNEAQLVLLAQGVFRWCRMDHTTVDDASYAEFVKCKPARLIQALETPAVHTVLRGRSLLNAFVAELDSVVRVSADSAVRQTVSRPQARVALTPAVVAAYTKAVSRAEGTVGFALGAEPIAQLFAILRTIDPDDPAWMTCGAGCCIAESLLM